MHNDEDWSGIAYHDGRFYLISGAMGDFILDYARYDPGFLTHPLAATYRLGVMSVGPNNVATFLRALNARELAPAEVRDMASSSDILAFIDFDARRFVHSYFDAPLEDYLPKGWHGALADPWQEIQRRLQSA